MDYKAYQYYIICEDTNHYHFIRRWLEKKGANKRRIFPDKMPRFYGDAKHYVKEHLPEAFRKLKARNANTRSCLIIAMDLDNRLRAEVENEIAAPADMPVFLVLPKWSIETWFLYITNGMDQTVNENEKSKHPKYSFHPAELGARLASADNNELCMKTPRQESLCQTIESIKERKRQLGLN